MLSQITSTPKKVTSFVARHRAKFAFAAGATTAVYLLNKTDRVSEFNAFLEEKGLTAEFYTPED